MALSQESIDFIDAEDEAIEYLGSSSNSDDNFSLPEIPSPTATAGSEISAPITTTSENGNGRTLQVDAKTRLKEERKLSMEKRKAEREEKQRLQLLRRQERRQIAEQKRQEKQQKRDRLATIRAQKPKNLIANILIEIDNRLERLDRQRNLEADASKNPFDNASRIDLRFVDADIPYSIRWRVKTFCPTDTVNDDLFVVLPLIEFIELVQGFVDGVPEASLSFYFQSMNLNRMNTTLVTIGLDSYISDLKNLNNRKFRQLVGENDGSDRTTTLNGLRGLDGLKTLASPDDVERALIDLQMSSNVNHIPVTDFAELSELIQYFTKSIAERPEKRKRWEGEASSLTRLLSSEGSFPKAVKLDADGSGSREIWRRMLLQCIPGHDRNFAEAVVQRYGCPQALLRAYRQCTDVKLAQNLLSDCDTGRRHYEASKKIHLVFTCTDNNVVLGKSKSSSDISANIL